MDNTFFGVAYFGTEQSQQSIHDRREVTQIKDGETTRECGNSGGSVEKVAFFGGFGGW